MQTFKPTCSMLCGMSIIASLVLPQPQPQSLSPPGVFVALLCRCGLLQLAAMLDGRCSAVAGGVFRCSAQEVMDLCCDFTPGSIAGIGSLGLLHRPPLCAWSLQMQVCLYGQCYSLHADWQALHLFFVLFIPCLWVPWKVLYNLNVLLVVAAVHSAHKPESSHLLLHTPAVHPHWPPVTCPKLVLPLQFIVKPPVLTPRPHFEDISCKSACIKPAFFPSVLQTSSTDTHQPVQSRPASPVASSEPLLWTSAAASFWTPWFLFFFFNLSRFLLTPVSSPCV